MQVQFSIINKKLNSTKQQSGTAFDCKLKKGSSKSTPYIELAANDPTDYNYAYIPNYGRYYYVDNWTFDGGLWSADLAVDVLASFKMDIGRASLYILRSSEAYDEKVLDTMYPAKEGGYADTQLLATPWTTDYAYGSYVLGVASKTAAAGAVAYYVLSYADMGTLRNFLMTEQYMPDFFDDWDTLYPQITGELVKSLINPFQYIASCMWLPFSMYAGGAASLDFGYWSSGLSFSTLAAQVYYHAIQIDVPQDFVGTPEEWRRQGPYATYQLMIQPFGCIDLDPTYMAQEQQLSIQIYVDPINGYGKMYVWGSSTRHVFACVSAQIGVPVQLSQFSADVMGAAGSAANGIGSFLTNAISGNIGGAIASAVNGIGDTAKASMPTVSNLGSNGGVGALAGQNRFTAYFRNIVDTDNDLLGRPYCKTGLPAALGGYMVIQNGDAVECEGTKEEKEQIKNFLEGGFYYE